MARQAARPLSPHLQIYRWYLTMATSIAHRISGVALVLGLLLLTWWLTALARGPDSFAVVRAVTDNILGGLVLFGFTFAIFFHLVNGIPDQMPAWVSTRRPPNSRAISSSASPGGSRSSPGSSS